MAIGSTLAGVARVAVEVDTGTSEQKLAEFDRRFVQTTGAMNEGAIRVELASRRLQRTLAQYPADSDKALRATLALKAAQRSAAAEAGALATRTRASGSAFKAFAHDVERGGFGIAVGSRAIHGLRSALFFSASGLAGFGLASAIRASRDAALEQQVTLGQLQVALRDAGLAQSAYTGTVKDTLDAQERLGFGQAESARSFALAVRATKSAEGATRLLAAASDIARGSGKSLQVSTLLLTRAYEGQTGGLRRVGIEIDKHAKGYQAVAQAQAQFAGAAARYSDSAAGAQARLNVAIHTTEETIGTALLPTITSLNTRLANWLDNSRNQERIQHDVNSVVQTGTKIAHDLGNAWKVVGPPVRLAGKLLGGTAHSIEILGGALLGLKLRAFARDMGLLTVRTEAAGAAATVSAGEFDLMAAAEGRAAGAGRGVGAGGGKLRALGGAVAVGIAAEYTTQGVQALSKYLGKTRVGSALSLGDTPLPKGVSFNDVIALKKKLDSGDPLSDRDRRVARALGVVVPDFSLSATRGAGPHGAAALAAAANATRRPTSLQGQFNIAALKLAQAGATATTTDDDVYLNQELAIADKQIAREKNLAKKTQLVDERNGILAQLQQNREQRTQTIADAARKRAADRKRAASAAESRRFGAATDVLQRLSARAGLQRGRGQFDDERKTLRAEEHDLEQYVKDTSLSLQHRRTLQRRLAQVRQQLDDIGRQIKQAAAKKQAAADARQGLLLDRAAARAALTETTDDDLRVYHAQEALINKKLAALARIKHLTNQQIQSQTDLLTQKKSIEDQIKGLAGQSSASSQAIIREFQSSLRGLYGGASNLFTEKNGFRSPGAVNVTFNYHGDTQPTQDKHREAIMAKHVFAGVAFDA